MVCSHASLYRSTILSDVEVQIRKPKSNDDCTPKAKRPRLHNGSVTLALALSDWEVVDAFPGHKCHFYVLCEFFKAKQGWSQLDTITFDVQEDQIKACQALIYYAYHEALQPGLLVTDVAQLLILSDEYQASSCMAACVQHLQATLNSGYSCDAVVEVCVVLAKLGAVSPGVKPLFACFEISADRLRHVLSEGLITTPRSASPKHRNHQNPAFDRAVAVLRYMFQDMEQVWGQHEFRCIIHVFPAEVMVAVLQWDGLCVASENLIVSAIDEWLHAQPPDLQNGRIIEEALLRTVRVPHLSPAFMTTVFPRLTWAERHKKLVGRMLMWAVLLAAPRNMPGTLSCPTDLQYMQHQRPHLAPPGNLTLEWEVSWSDIHATWLAASQFKSCQALFMPCPKWVNGYRVWLGLDVWPAQPYGSPLPWASVHGFWCWDGPCVSEQPKRSDELRLLASYTMEFNSSPGSGIMLVQPLYEREAEECPYNHMCGKCELVHDYPANAEQLARDGHKLHCNLLFSDIM